MPKKLTKEELLFLMRLASPQRPLNLVVRGPDDVLLIGEATSWAQQWITYIRIQQADQRDREAAQTKEHGASISREIRA